MSETRNQSEVDSYIRLLENIGVDYKVREFFYATDRAGKTHWLRRLDYYNQTLLEQLHLGEGDQPDTLVSRQFPLNQTPKYWPPTLPDVPPAERLLQLLEND